MPTRLYLDNAATSWPKPPEVVDAINQSLVGFSGSPGRSGHQFSIRANRVLFETRELLAALFQVTASERVVFTLNATHALNTAIKGVLRQGDHVIISMMEHNSVLRPLRHLEQAGCISLTIVECNRQGAVDPAMIEAAFTPATRLVVTIHGSNVTGTIFPVREIGKICRKHQAYYLVDAAQTAGFLPISLVDDEISMLAFSGHKCLLGPTGTGGLCIGEGIEIASLVEGGSGSRSERGFHPDFYPDHLEAGTPNSLGIAGLRAGVKVINAMGLPQIQKKQLDLTRLFIEGLNEISGAIVYGPEAGSDRLPVISMNLTGRVPSEVAYILDHEYGIMTRAGLHCSPLAHHTLGTAPEGTVRLSIGHFNTEDEIGYTLQCLQQISKASNK